MEKEIKKHIEILTLKEGKQEINKDDELSKIRWYKEMITFDTLREADEWVYSGDGYNKIGSEFDGYMTGDPKLAYALVYQLIRANTLKTRPLNVFADEQYKDGETIYMVWVSS